jgi:hypothetical protein
LKCGKPRKKM